MVSFLTDLPDLPDLSCGVLARFHDAAIGRHVNMDDIAILIELAVQIQHEPILLTTLSMHPSM